MRNKTASLLLMLAVGALPRAAWADLISVRHYASGGPTLNDVCWIKGTNDYVAVGAAGIVFPIGEWGQTPGTPQSLDYHYDLTGVSLTKNQNVVSGFAVGYKNDSTSEGRRYKGAIWRTTDGGSNWNRVPDEQLAPYVRANAIPFLSVRVTSPNSAWISCGNGVVLRTTDGGANWRRTAVDPGGDSCRHWFWGLDALDSLVACVTSDGSGLAAFTTDGGQSWRRAYPALDTRPDTSLALRRVRLDPKYPGRAVAVGSEGSYFETDNYGAYWTCDSLLDYPTEDLRGVLVDTSTNDEMWLVGTGGIVLASPDLGDLAWYSPLYDLNAIDGGWRVAGGNDRRHWVAVGTNYVVLALEEVTSARSPHASCGQTTAEHFWVQDIPGDQGWGDTLHWQCALGPDDSTDRYYLEMNLPANTDIRETDPWLPDTHFTHKHDTLYGDHDAPMFFDPSYRLTAVDQHSGPDDTVYKDSVATNTHSIDDNPPPAVTGLSGRYDATFNAILLRWNAITPAQEPNLRGYRVCPISGGLLGWNHPAPIFENYYTESRDRYPPGPQILIYRVMAIDRSNHYSPSWSNSCTLRLPGFAASNATAINGGRKLIRGSVGSDLHRLADVGSSIAYEHSSDDGATWNMRIPDFGAYPCLAVAGDGAPWVTYLRDDTVIAAVLNSSGAWTTRLIFAGSSTHRPGPPSLAVFQGTSGRLGNVAFPVYDSVGTGRSMILFAQFGTSGDILLDTADYCDGSAADSAASIAVGQSDSIYVVFQRAESVFTRTLIHSPTSTADPDTWASFDKLNAGTARGYHPCCEQVGDRLYVAFRLVQPSMLGDAISIQRASWPLDGSGDCWEGMTAVSDINTTPKDWPTLSTDQVVVWSESLSGLWVARARVADSLLTLTSPDSNSRFCHVLADTAVADAPSTSKTRIRYLWTQQVAGDTYAVQYALKDVKVSNADGNATRYNNGSKLVRSSSDTLHTVYRTRAGAVYHAQKPDDPNAGWTTASIASSGDLPALDRDYADRLWAVYRRNGGTQLDCRWRSAGSTAWTRFAAYSTSGSGMRLGAPAIAAAPSDPTESGRTAAYIALVVYDSIAERNSLVVIKVDTTGVMYTDTLDFRDDKDGRDSFPALALATVPDDGYYIYLLWQQCDSIVGRLSRDPDDPATGIPAWSNSGAVSDPGETARHPALAAGSALVTAVWIEDTPGEVLARQQEPGAGFDAWDDRVYVSASPDTACDYPTADAGDSLVIAWQQALGPANWDILACINFNTQVNLTQSGEPSTCGHVRFELHQDTIPLIHCVWTEDLSANYSEVGYRRWQLGVTGGGYGGGQSAGRIDPTITPGLLAPAPNPFRDRTTIAYATNTTGPVRVRIYDALGREVCALVNARHEPGRYRATWDRKDNRGRQAAKGIYFVRLDTPNCRQNRKLILVP